MDTVIVLEPDTPTNVRLLGPDHEPADPENPVRLAHTAPVGASGVCGPLTLCGLDTSDMTVAPHRTTDDGRPWPYWNTCTTCRDAEKGTAPGATGPGTPEGATAPDPPPTAG
ncbi:hypothetical protein [Streptomyces sp. CBMA123]|uniref:hypothetical protein n=1 Tax=Streptomyces sp. CBMA123 TaxID=1896313 RepID=UPI00166208E2|nr:hypothetical protein [Streptomyces sp. CBMA123]MBD0693228.1 hypothetical protein [Streptomyces sp. CBMA123]